MCNMYRKYAKNFKQNIIVSFKYKTWHLMAKNMVLWVQTPLVPNIQCIATPKTQFQGYKIVTFFALKGCCWNKTLQ